MLVYERMQLKSMPYDKWDDEAHSHIHATGYAVFNGIDWLTEYEDDDYTDAENCVYSSEWDEEYEDDEEEEPMYSSQYSGPWDMPGYCMSDFI